MRKIAVLLLGAAALAASGAGLFAWIDRTAAYHSPLRAAARRPVPRDRGLEDLARFRAERAEEAARRAELLASLTPETMVALGNEIVHGKGLCMNCHRIDGEGSGTQGPDLGGVGARARGRVAGLDGVEYLAESLYHPEAFVVPGFSPAMPEVNGPPMGLSDLEILLVVSYLQSLGGTTTVTPGTRLPFSPGGPVPVS